MENNLTMLGAVSLNATRRLFGMVRDHRDCLAGLGIVVAYVVAQVWGIAS
ncbi:MAG TPA: hypothetical protein VJT81_19350 [Burkholderiales bacterium]|nr:hypothetical protein [Burkholderiales bacterium]